MIPRHASVIDVRKQPEGVCVAEQDGVRFPESLPDRYRRSQ
jgi:hypothetical protein